MFERMILMNSKVISWTHFLTVHEEQYNLLHVFMCRWLLFMSTSKKRAPSNFCKYPSRDNYFAIYHSTKILDLNFPKCVGIDQTQGTWFEYIDNIWSPKLYSSSRNTWNFNWKVAEKFHLDNGLIGQRPFIGKHSLVHENFLQSPKIIVQLSPENDVFCSPEPFHLKSIVFIYVNGSKSLFLQLTSILSKNFISLEYDQKIKNFFMLFQGFSSWSPL